jgi:hypothetical protein
MTRPRGTRKGNGPERKQWIDGTELHRHCWQDHIPLPFWYILGCLEGSSICIALHLVNRCSRQLSLSLSLCRRPSIRIHLFSPFWFFFSCCLTPRWGIALRSGAPILLSAKSGRTTCKFLKRVLVFQGSVSTSTTFVYNRDVFLIAFNILLPVI